MIVESFIPLEPAFKKDRLNDKEAFEIKRPINTPVDSNVDYN